MSSERRHKILSIISLVAILTNLFPFHALPAHAATIDLGEPAQGLHRTPQALMITEARPLTTVGGRARSILPGWFVLPTISPLDYQRTAGLTLAPPSVLAQRPPVAIKRAAAAPNNILPHWFNPAENPTLAPQGEAVAVPVRPDRLSNVLPHWFAGQPATAPPARPGLEAIAPAESAGGILPGWFAEPGAIAALPAGPGEDSTGSRAPPATLAQPSTVLPAWFNQPPARPAAAPIPGLVVTVLAPATVSAGDEAVGGDTYTVTVVNNGNESAVQLAISVTIPSIGFKYITGSATFFNPDGNSVAINEVITGLNVRWDPQDGVLVLNPGRAVTLTFKMSTDGTAVSGQRLSAAAIYNESVEDPDGDRTEGGRNITVGYGNLIISKSPSLQEASFLDRVGWDIQVANTGLGNLYNVVVTDTIGRGFAEVDFSQISLNPIIPVIGVGERVNYRVTATVNSCTGITNTALAWWSLGNEPVILDGIKELSKNNFAHLQKRMSSCKQGADNIVPVGTYPAAHQI